MTQTTSRRIPYFRILLAAIALLFIWFTYLHVVRPLFTWIGSEVDTSIGSEIERVESPDHVQAVVIERNPGALEPYAYDVYLAKLGSKNLGNPVLVAFGKNDLKLRWVSPKLLEISYSDACIASFHNHWGSMELQNGFYDVEIRLKPPDDATPRQPCA